MALYRYVKAPPKKRRDFSGKRYISASLTLLGLFLIGWVAYPIVEFEVISYFKYARVVQPIPENHSAFAWEDLQLQKTEAEQTPQDTVVLGETTTNTVEGTELDYTKASTWFPNRPQSDSDIAGRIYYLSIPKLRIQDARVKIAGEDLDKTLIHYGGTGIPGEYGTTVVFGHSILPQFYDPTNYKAIFSLLPKLEQGDEIFLKYDGVTYRYVVYDMRVTTPEDISVLEQRFDSSYLSLITCAPPGTYWRRLLVKARLERL